MSDLAFHIRQFVPDCADGEELEQREALLKARDFAAALRGRTEGSVATEHAIHAHELAGAFVFAPVPLPVLQMAVKYCRCMVQAAFIADHFEREFPE